VADAEQERLQGIAGHIEDELAKRRENEHHAADMAAKAKRDADVLEGQCNDLRGTVESMERQNSEFTSFCSTVGAECAELKSQINDLENALTAEETAKKERDDSIAKLSGEKVSGDEETARLSRDIRDLSQANNRLREEMESAEEKSRRLGRDMKNIERRLADIDEVASREGRAKGDCEASNKHLAEQLEQALSKIDALSQQCNEADLVVKGKEREVNNAQERLRDEASRVLRLEQQLIELGSQVTQLGRPQTRF
jgi:chromosome segregation protein